MKKLKSRLKSGETLWGCWLNLGSSVTAEIVGSAGFDWVLIDLEHGAGSEAEAFHQLQALQGTDAAAVVRVESGIRQRIHRVLDMGAEGVMCPRVSTPEEAKDIVKSLRYPPKGKRGVAKMVRTTGFGKNFAEYAGGEEENLLGIAQIETKQALDHLDQIATTDGIDVLFIGPADLTMDLGIFGQFDHERFREALQKIVQAAESAGKSVGILLSDPEDVPIYHKMGIRLIACGADGAFVANGSRSTVQKMNSHIPTKTHQTS